MINLEVRQQETNSRYQKEYNWYRIHSRRAKWNFCVCKVLQIFASASIPIVSIAVTDNNSVRVATAVLGAIIALIEGILQLFQSDRNWQRWASCAEGLERERTLFLQGVGPYDSNDPEVNRLLFSTRIEEIVSHEVGLWAEQQAGIVGNRSINPS